MKKIIYVALVFAALVSITACAKKTDNLKDVLTQGSLTIDDIRNQGLTQNDTAKTEVTSNWKTEYVLDKFGQPTEEKYVTNTEMITGTFSNDAEKDATLTVRMTVSAEGRVAFYLYKYGYVLMTHTETTGNSYYSDVCVRYEDGVEEEHSGTMSNANHDDNDRVRMSFSNAYGNTKFFDALEKGGSIFFCIEPSRFSDESTYVFSIDATGFSEQYNLVKAT